MCGCFVKHYYIYTYIYLYMYVYNNLIASIITSNSRQNRKIEYKIDSSLKIIILILIGSFVVSTCCSQFRSHIKCITMEICSASLLGLPDRALSLEISEGFQPVSSPSQPSINLMKHFSNLCKQLNFFPNPRRLGILIDLRVFRMLYNSQYVFLIQGKKNYF